MENQTQIPKCYTSACIWCSLPLGSFCRARQNVFLTGRCWLVRLRPACIHTRMQPSFSRTKRNRILVRGSKRKKNKCWYGSFAFLPFIPSS